MDGLLDPALTSAVASREHNAGIGSTPTSNNFRISELVTLADLMLLTRKPLETITLLRQTARWLDGRANEDYWDAVNDRRDSTETSTHNFASNATKKITVARSRTPNPHPLDPEIRLRLGKARMMLGDVTEAATL